MFKQKSTRDFFRAQNPALVQVICHREQFARQRFDPVKLGHSLCGFIRASERLQKLDLGVPTSAQRGIAARCRLKRI